jgi:hypothetical protein
MEFTMRIIEAMGLVAIGGMLALAPARADTVPPFKGNDIRALAISHCASYGKVVKFLAIEAHYGGYISFACRWLPYGAAGQPVRAAY